jgi:hypothetical protein
MAFFDIFTKVAGLYPAETFIQVVLGDSKSATITIGPRADESQQKHYQLADKEAFASAVEAAMTGDVTVLDAFAAQLPPADEATTTSDTTAATTDAPADTTTTTSEAPAQDPATTTSTPAA